MGRINRHAQNLKNAGDRRSIDQIRADAFLDILNGKQLADHESKGVVDISIDLKTLAELSDAPGRPRRLWPGHRRHRPPSHSISAELGMADHRHQRIRRHHPCRHYQPSTIPHYETIDPGPTPQMCPSRLSYAGHPMRHRSPSCRHRR